VENLANTAGRAGDLFLFFDSRAKMPWWGFDLLGKAQGVTSFPRWQAGGVLRESHYRHCRGDFDCLLSELSMQSYLCFFFGSYCGAKGGVGTAHIVHFVYCSGDTHTLSWVPSAALCYRKIS